MDQSARFALPFLAPGQTQKEWFHNEALQLLDLLICAAVEGLPQSDPPASPVIGQCYIVADNATGAWTGQDGALAGFTDGGWRFVPAVEGMQATIRATGETMLRRGGLWEAGILHALELRIGGQPVLGGRQPAIAEPAGGNMVDIEARTAVSGILAALRTHGLIET